MKCHYPLAPINQQHGEVFCGAIPSPDPNDFGWMTIEKAPVVKVRIFRNDRIALSRSVRPYCRVGRSLKAEIPDVTSLRIHVR